MGSARADLEVLAGLRFDAFVGGDDEKHQPDAAQTRKGVANEPLVTRNIDEADLEILPGEVRPYSWVAKEIGKPNAVRAVGTALARNPVPIVLPCHRVVRTDGELGNYYYGTDVKRAVLAAEGMDMELMDDRVARGIRLVGSDTTLIFCHPTCRDARRITERHLVEFRDESDARGTGYRPCQHCRPAAA